MSGAGDARRVDGPWRYRALWGPDLAVLLACAAATAALFSFGDLDLRITRHFYAGWRQKPFFLHLAFPWRFLYVYIGVPVAATALGAFVALWRSYREAAWRRWRIHALYVLLAIVLGPGLVVNAVLKDHWGRPRPRHVQEFGGRQEYRQALEPGGSGQGKSFPCGHSSAGYFFCVFYFVFRRERRRLGLLLLALAALLGTVLGYGRVISGSHFTSDVAWSAWVVALVAWALYYFVLNVPGREDAGLEALAPAEARGAAWRWGVIAGAVVAASLFAAPYTADLLYEIALPPAGPPAEARLHFERGDLDLVFGGTGNLHVQGLADGFGLVGSKLKRSRSVRVGGDGRPLAEFALRRRGMFTELNVQATVYVPTDRVDRVRLALDEGNVAVRAPEGFRPGLEIEVGKGTVVLPEAWAGHGLPVRVGRGEVRYEDPPPRPAAPPP